MWDVASKDHQTDPTVLPAVGVTVNLTAEPFRAVVGVTVTSAEPDGAWVVAVTTVADGVDPLREFVTAPDTAGACVAPPEVCEDEPETCEDAPESLWVPSVFPENWLLPIESPELSMAQRP
jgi:hypothetical protein